MKRVKFEDPKEGGSADAKTKKHTLDSDEEDSSDDEKPKVGSSRQDSDHEDYDRFGEEDGVSRFDGEVKLTPFNMKEELEEGRFDKDGHYLFNKEKEVSDNWLDNIDWIKVKADKEPKKDSDSDDDDAPAEPFNTCEGYKEILSMMLPKETVKKALQRLGVRISSAERWKRKKLGTLEDSSKAVMRLTELANDILTKTGNMNIYEETYEVIEKKLRASSASTLAPELDMFGDDDDNGATDGNTFAEKERTKTLNEEPTVDQDKPLLWEYKLKAEDEATLGPHTTLEMLRRVNDGTFKDGVFVRKVGQETRFYNSNRIDFELYLA